MIRAMQARTMAGGFLLALAGAPAVAQQSAHYVIKAPVINSGGHPVNGLTPVSAGLALRTDALGEGAVSASMASASFSLSGGFVQSFPTPGEVDNLVFTDAITLGWDPEPLADRYHLYRTGAMGAPTGASPGGDCLQPGLTAVTTNDGGAPPAARAFFYFVNAASCIGVEGPAATTGARCP